MPSQLLSRSPHPTLKTLKDCIENGTQSTSASSEVEAYAAGKLEEMATRPHAFKEALCGLLECLPEANSAAYTQGGEGAEMVAVTMRTIFGLCASQSGTLVQVNDNQSHKDQSQKDGVPKVGVLVLGYGGASMPELEFVVEHYKALRPACKTVITTCTALSSAVAFYN